MAFTSYGITIYIDNGIHVIKFNNPRQKNALNKNSYKVITKSLNDAANNPEVLITVFTGEGDYYTSGFAFPASNVTDNIEQIINESLENVRYE